MDYSKDVYGATLGQVGAALIAGMIRGTDHIDDPEARAAAAHQFGQDIVGTLSQYLSEAWIFSDPALASLARKDKPGEMNGLTYEN